MKLEVFDDELEAARAAVAEAAASVSDSRAEAERAAAAVTPEAARSKKHREAAARAEALCESLATAAIDGEASSAAKLRDAVVEAGVAQRLAAAAMRAHAASEDAARQAADAAQKASRDLEWRRLDTKIAAARAEIAGVMLAHPELALRSGNRIDFDDFMKEVDRARPFIASLPRAAAINYELHADRWSGRFPRWALTNGLPAYEISARAVTVAAILAGVQTECRQASNWQFSTFFALESAAPKNRQSSEPPIEILCRPVGVARQLDANTF